MLAWKFFLSTGSVRFSSFYLHTHVFQVTIYNNSMTLFSKIKYHWVMHRYKRIVNVLVASKLNFQYIVRDFVTCWNTYKWQQILALVNEIKQITAKH